MNAKEFIDWESQKKEEAEQLKDELMEIARKNPRAKEFATVLSACLEWEWQKHNAMFLGGNESKEELKSFKKAIEVAQRLVNNAISEE